MSLPEFSRRVPLDRIGRKAMRHEIIATADERAALAARFALISLDRLEAEFDILLAGDAPLARGRVKAAAARACVATGEPVAQAVDIPVAIRFVASSAQQGDEIQLAVEDCDEMDHDGQAIDLGEAAAQTLALALDPFPRSAGAAEALAAAGVLDERQTGAFAGLRALLAKD